jgi:hypothetical protein
MLLYRNRLFSTDSVQRRTYHLKYDARCKLSCRIFTFSCTDIILHSILMYKHWHSVYKYFWRNASGNLTPGIAIKGISLSEHCLYQTADSCTIAYYIPITRVVQTCTSSRKYLFHTMIFHVHCMNQEEPCTDRYIICVCHVYSMYKQVYTLQNTSFQYIQC